MRRHGAKIVRERGSAEILDRRYRRAHEILFGGGLRVMGSSWPKNLPPPMSAPGYVDPEQALAASASSCHTQAFPYLASRADSMVESYRDHAAGQVDEVAPGKPAIAFSGARLPTPGEFDKLDRAALESCHVANSIKAGLRTAFRTAGQAGMHVLRKKCRNLPEIHAFSQNSGKSYLDNHRYSGKDDLIMKTILVLTMLAATLASCGGGGGNAGTCYPASVCGQKGSSATTYAETSRTAGSPVQAEAKDAAPHDADQVRN